ncbi:MAG: universal stress protein [Actinobacteria bacterium]|nr:universal stress protein [Actinomycetota bacterium]
MRTRTRVRRDLSGAPPRASGRPVLLATLGVPFDERAAAFAVDSAVESGSPLIVANVTALEPLGLSVMLGYDALEEFTPEVSASVRRPVELAQSLGLTVERLRVRSPRPVQALLELASSRRAGLLVFGPDRRAIRDRTYRRAIRRIREGTPCLLSTADPV